MAKSKRKAALSSANNEDLISFDVYFSMICKSNDKIKAHHKKAIEKFIKDKIGLVATKQNFDEIFKQY